MKKIIIGATLLAFAVAAAVAVSAPMKQQEPQTAICNGQVVGQDPDPNIVQQLQRECGNNQ